MHSPGVSVAALAAFVLATLLGLFTRRKLDDRFISAETTAVLHTTVGMLVTFAAIVVGLLMNSAKTNFSTAESVMQGYAASLTSLSDALHAAGQAGAPIQKSLAAYTATSIAATWAWRPPPPGDYYPKGVVATSGGQLMESPVLADLLDSVAEQVAELPAETAPQRQLRARSLALVERVTQQRWSLISASQVSLSGPFFVVLVFWMSIAFLCLGLSASANRLSLTVIVLSAVAMASALYVIVDLDSLYDNGFFTLPTAPMDGALARMLHEARL
jgi:hypothetical protein